MQNSGKQLKKYKAIRAKLKKDFPKGFQYHGVTLDLFYGGNKEVDISRISIGGVSSHEGFGNELYALIMQGVEDNIEFWQKCVVRDMQDLEESLKQK